MFLLAFSQNNMPFKSPGSYASSYLKKTPMGKSSQGRMFIDIGAAKIDQTAERIAFSAAHKFQTAFRRKSKDHKIRPGVHTGVIENPSNSYVCCASPEVTYKHQISSSIQDSVAKTKIWRDNLQIGVPTSRSLYEFGKNRVVDTKLLVDTERDYLSTNKRQSLTCTFGFNQKSFNFLLNDTFLSVSDYKFLFRNHEKRLADKLAKKNIYGNIYYEKISLKIKSETDYYTLRTKLHLVKIKNPAISVEDLIRGTFINKESAMMDNQNLFTIQQDRQLCDKPNILDQCRGEILTDLKCSLKSSTFFKDNATIVRTIRRNLGPNDVWQTNVFVHYGPGLSLNKLFEEGEEKNYRFPFSSNGHPASYFIIIETQGDPRASITRRTDGTNFDGSSPGRYDISFSKSLRFVREQDELGAGKLITTRQFISNDEDFQDEELANYFQRDRETKINVPFQKVNVNRTEEPDVDYDLRYGEGRLVVYLDPKYKAAIVRDATDKKSENDILDPDSILDPSKSPSTEYPNPPSLRSGSGNNSTIDLDEEDDGLDES